jgi:hypothetical protein
VLLISVAKASRPDLITLDLYESNLD